MGSPNFATRSPAAKRAPPSASMAERILKSLSLPLPPLAEPSFVLHKQHTWSPDFKPDEEWTRLKRRQRRRFRNSSSGSVTVNDDDMNELKACIDLGFGFNTPNLDPKLSRIFPALELYSAVNRLSRSSSSASSEASDSSLGLSGLFDPSDGLEKRKMKLRHGRKRWLVQFVKLLLRPNRFELNYPAKKRLE